MCFVRFVCRKEISIEHGGRTDCSRHISSSLHQSNSQLMQNNVSITSYMKSDEKSYDIIKAETLFTNFIIEHNLPLTAADHTGALFKKMFPDSEIAKKYACKRTKATQIMYTLGKNSAEYYVEILKSNPFSIATDGSNDRHSTSQLYPIVARLYDRKVGRVVSVLLSMPANHMSSTGENIYKIVEIELEKKGIPMQNLISFGCDNASVMMGKHKGVSAFLKKKLPSVFIQGCACHLIHLAAETAAKKLKIKVELLLVDLYYYFDKSTKRSQEFKKFQVLCDTDTHKILKHVTTRWLSLGLCIKRLIEQWDALAMYFKVDSHGKRHATDDENENVKKKQKTQSHLTNTTSLITTKNSDQHKAADKNLKPIEKEYRRPGTYAERIIAALTPETKLYSLFLDYAIPIFDNVNLLLQNDAPQIHKLRNVLIGLLTELMVRFVTPKAISKAKDVFSVSFKEAKNQKGRGELVIGSVTRAYIASGALSDSQLNTFYHSVRDYYVTACEYILKKFPLQDLLLKHVEVIDIKNRANVSFESLNYFIDRFPCLLETSGTKDVLQVEFCKYQVDNSLPKVVLEAERLDLAWHEMSILKDKGTEKLKYSTLSYVMLNIMVIPHSNADSERIFSMVRKNRTESRSSMSDVTLEALIVQKVAILSQNVQCYNYDQKLSKELLLKAKKATTEYNEEHGSFSKAKNDI